MDLMDVSAFMAPFLGIFSMSLHRLHVLSVSTVSVRSLGA